MILVSFKMAFGKNISLAEFSRISKLGKSNL